MVNRRDERDSRGVTYRGNMLLQWEERADGEPSTGPDQGDKNERLLRAMLFSQDIHHEHGDESGDRLAADLARVEAKLDLLLDMVSGIVRTEQCAAVELVVTLWLGGAVWRTGNDPVPAVGDRLWLSLYIDSRLAQPLRLPVRVTRIEAVEQENEVTVAFEDLDEPVLDLLGKLIFRQHRRMIAQQKSGKRSPPRE